MPLLSFVITSYNQKDLILHALRAAFNQTYSSLEIIIADDGSTDGSVALLEAEIEKYRQGGGRHQVRLLTTEKNQGVLRNCERAFSMAQGELIVLGGGDDISCPERVEVIAKNWLAADKKPTVVFHGMELIDGEGKVTGAKHWQPNVRNPLGAAMAFSPCVVKNFELSKDTRGYEDAVFARRAYLLGESLFVADRLVHYRWGSGDTTNGEVVGRRRRISFAMLHAAIQNQIDLEAVKGQIPIERYREVKSMVRDVYRQYKSENDLVAGKSFVRRFYGFLRYVRHPQCMFPLCWHSFRTYYLPLVSPRLSRLLVLIKNCIRSEAK